MHVSSSPSQTHPGEGDSSAAVRAQDEDLLQEVRRLRAATGHAGDRRGREEEGHRVRRGCIGRVATANGRRWLQRQGRGFGGKVVASAARSWLQRQGRGFSGKVVASAARSWLRRQGRGFGGKVVTSAARSWFQRQCCSFNDKVMASAARSWVAQLERQGRGL